MKKIVMIWFLAANVFCFVTAAVGLSRPWGIDLPATTDQARVEDVVLLTQSALGGAAGSYAALEWTDRFAGTEFLHRRIALYALMVQNFLGYGIALLLAAMVDRRRSMSRSNHSEYRSQEARHMAPDWRPHREDTGPGRSSEAAGNGPDALDDEVPAQFG